MHREPIFAARLEPPALVPRDGVTDARLRSRRSDDDGFANRARGVDQRRKASGVYAVVVSNQELHRLRAANVERRTPNVQR